MATDKEYVQYLAERMSDAEGMSLRAMMGEYVLYCKGKVVGGVYDNRLLVKPTASAAALMPDAVLVYPYEGAKQQYLVDNLEDKDFLKRLLEGVADDLPAPKVKKKYEQYLINQFNSIGYYSRNADCFRRIYFRAWIARRRIKCH
ncbi:MAG: TfoX/Sxy family protein [Clostridia bacterium]|nr:TfoX/Sxy family protein [Clostridia bacterium]